MNTTKETQTVCSTATAIGTGTAAATKVEKSEHHEKESTFVLYSEKGIRITDQPILPRIDRLDNLLRHLEEMRINRRPWSPTKSSCASTPTSGALTSEFGRNSSFDDSSPGRKVIKPQHYRSINEAIYEAERKGTLLQRLDLLEDRVLKVCMELERNEATQLPGKERVGGDQHTKKKKKRSGLKQFVKSCVRGNTKPKNSKSNRR